MKRTTILVVLLLRWVEPALAQDSLARFRAYKENYFLLTTVNHWSETKFQFSFQFRLLDSTKIYLGYTQKSFWNAWDFALSSPFKESNYNPELFYRYRINSSEENYLQSGVEHESNGRDGLESRGWNRAYLLANTAIFSFFGLRGKLWYPFASDHESRTIQQNLGYGEIELQFFKSSRSSLIGLTIDLRKGTNSGIRNGGVQVGLIVRPIKLSGASLYLQYFNGMGESLLNFNQPVKQFRMGIMMIE